VAEPSGRTQWQKYENYQKKSINELKIIIIALLLVTK
jgi:hypothetical protein